jgi:uncharacterized protein (TIGR03437 family)
MGSQEGRTRLGVTSTGFQRALFSLTTKCLGLAALACLFTPQAAFGQARLRLTETALGPISVATGANGPAQTVEAFNLGSGALSLTLASNSTWLAGSVGSLRPCQATTQQSTCLPLNLALNTAGLTRGTYTGVITVRDPNAIDAPQSISVTIQVGGGIPDTIFLYTPPNGGTDSVTFSTNSVLNTISNTQTGGNWLTVAYEGQGSFRFIQPYRVSGQHLPGMAEGTYNGTIRVDGSSFSGDNKTVQTRLVVTSQPIAFAAPNRISVRVAQNSGESVVNVGVGNRGRGSLALTSIATTENNGTNWLSAVLATTFTGSTVTFRPGSLAPGTYRGLVGMATNSINAPALLVPVEMEVIANPLPTVSTGGILNNANFASGDSLGVGTIAALFGEFLTDQLYFAPGAPLPTTLGGVRVLVNGRAAPIYFASPSQINFQVPLETLGGSAVVQVERNGVVGNRASVNVVAQAGRILVWSGLRYGIIVNADGTLPLPASVRLGNFVSKPARGGDTLVIYAIGFGQTNPSVQTGAASPSSPLAQLSNVIVRFGVPDAFGSSIPVSAQFAGLSPGFVGLFQINVQVPEGIPAFDEYDLSIEYNNQASNRVKIATGQ